MRALLLLLGFMLSACGPASAGSFHSSFYGDGDGVAAAVWKVLDLTAADTVTDPNSLLNGTVTHAAGVNTVPLRNDALSLSDGYEEGLTYQFNLEDEYPDFDMTHGVLGIRITWPVQASNLEDIIVCVGLRQSATKGLAMGAYQENTTTEWGVRWMAAASDGGATATAAQSLITTELVWYATMQLHGETSSGLLGGVSMGDPTGGLQHTGTTGTMGAGTPWAASDFEIIASFGTASATDHGALSNDIKIEVSDLGPP
jgi:hypothetical protein